VPLGFPIAVARAGTVKGSARHELDLTGARPGSIDAKVLLYPSPVASMSQGTRGMLREPSGCFEQTSSSNYPNVMILRYLQTQDAVTPALLGDVTGKLSRGYKLLSGYEAKDRGYEWFGQSPGHEALTAYGLMEFKDMKDVWGDVDGAMVERTANWLLARRDGQGGYQRNAKALDSFGRASAETTNLYITWALSEAGRTRGFDKELAYVRDRRSAKDPYALALVANTLLNVAPTSAEAKAAMDALLRLQAKDGSFPGAAQSITMSGGSSLLVETTSLATLALVKASPHGEYETQLRAAVAWLDEHRGGHGEWGSTQGTVLALKALSAYADHARQTQSAGVATLVINGRKAGVVAFEKGRREAIEFEGFASALVAGKNVVDVQLTGEAAMPYSLAVDYRAARPASSPDAVVGLETSLAATTVKMGEGVTLHARIRNRSDQGQPMTLARVGIPGGLTFQTWQLKELRDKGLIGFYETNPREVILYFRALAPSQVIDLDLNLLAAVPGSYVAPASSAYLYYTNEHKAWVAPVSVRVTK
jgi:uncharacterized protein YfaS (alpha-2-macroglobulin family)